MKSVTESDGRLVVSLARGDDLRSGLEGLALEKGLVGAQVSGIGAVEDVIVGAYDLESQRYDRHNLDGIWELISADGNLTLLDGKPFLHLHVTVGDHQLQVRGGHLFDARIAVVGEFFVTPLRTPLPRIPCAAIGLPRWEPGG